MGFLQNCQINNMLNFDMSVFDLISGIQIVNPIPGVPVFKNSSSNECFLVDFPTFEKRAEDEVDGAVGDDGEFVSILP